MGLFSRFTRVIKANINQLLSKSEDPEKMLNQLVHEMSGQLVEAKRSVATAIADEKLLERRVQEHRRKAEEWERRAILALKEADKEPDRREYYEDLSKKALTKQKEYNIMADKFQEQVVAQHDSVEKLKVALAGLQKRIEESQRKKSLLIARARRAEAQKKIQDQITGLADTSAFEAFEKMSTQIEHIEAETEAIAELEVPVVSNLEEEFNLLEGGKTDKKMLDDLREKIAKGEIVEPKTSAQPRPSSPPSPPDPEVDLMMEELKKRLDKK